jgi:Ni/Fe-hydrogenase subunit HybB-like protein
MIKNVWEFLVGSFRLTLKGNRTYHLWMGFLAVLILSGVLAYYRQYTEGLIVTSMRDQVSWAFYIGNFTFLVGVAAAAVLLVIPAYVYNWKPIREIAIFGELLAISAIVMCLLFVTVDIGQPTRVLELLPFVGSLNVPSSLLAWDVLVLNGYLVLNTTIVVHFLSMAYFKKPYNKAFVVPLLLLSIPAAISIHTVTAFVYNGMAARPFWNASILAPRFIASALCSGPAVMLILFQVLSKTTHIRIRKEAISKIAELMAYAMFLNLFLFGVALPRGGSYLPYGIPEASSGPGS